MSAMILNIASNVLGLGNAATPFGIRAMQELDRLNPVKGTATNAMVLFLAINTAGLAIIPTSVVALRAASGSKDPAGIVFTTWFASAAATHRRDPGGEAPRAGFRATGRRILTAP